MSTTTSSDPHRLTPMRGLRLAAAAFGTGAALAAGPLLVPRLVSISYTASIVFDAVWLTAGVVVLGRATRSDRVLRRTVRGSALLTSLAFAGVFVWGMFHTNTVHENVVRGAPASAATAAGNVQVAMGTFSGLDVSASGTAAVVSVPGGGRQLTLTNFKVENGPDLRVYLATGNGKRLGTFKDLGKLKGNSGDQQYTVPANLDVRSHSTVVIYCRSFASPFAQAKLISS